MADIQEQLFEKLRAVRASGQAEYAHDEGNAMANFERLAAELGLPREKVLWIFLRKHLDGILAYINGYQSQREPVEGRILDAIMYLMLLHGMQFDDTRPFNPTLNPNVILYQQSSTSAPRPYQQTR